MDFLGRCHLEVSGICDQNANMRQKFSEYPFYLPEELSIEQGKEMFVIIVINDKVVTGEVENFLREKGFSKISYFNSVFFDNRFSHYFWCGNAKDAFPVFCSTCLRYMYRHLIGKKEIYLYSSDITYMIEVFKILKAIGIRINHAVTEKIVGGIEIPSDLTIINAYNLLCVKSEEFVIWALPGELEKARELMNGSGLPKKNFMYSSTDPLLLNRTYIPDTHLGYIDSRGVMKYRNCGEGEDIIKVAILGDSTSDYDLHREKSWAACLLETARDADVNMECIMGATCGNISMQEIVRLIRDVLQEKPDVVISYSCFNDMNLSCLKYRRTHRYQRSLFEIVTQSSDDIAFFNISSSSEFHMGAENKEAVHTWIENKRIMHAICEEFGIVFLAFTQPRVYDKLPKTSYDLECIEHLCNDKPARIERETEFIKQVHKEIEGYSWIYNFTNIFDGVEEEIFFDNIHLLEYGNRILAQKIFSIVKGIEGVKIGK